MGRVFADSHRARPWLTQAVIWKCLVRYVVFYAVASSLEACEPLALSLVDADTIPWRGTVRNGSRRLGWAAVFTDEEVAQAEESRSGPPIILDRAVEAGGRAGADVVGA